MKNRENKIQHYVPQCYLRNFSPNGIYVFIYDKIEKKQFSNAIEKIACKDYFYELPEKFIKNISEIPYGTKYFEKEFFANNVEKLLGKLLETIINKGNSWSENEKNVEVLNKEEKNIFAQLIAIQYLRMPDIREKYSDARKKSDDLRLDIIKGFLSHENPDLKDTIENIHGEYDKTFDPILHSEIFADEEIFLGIANQIINKHWIFYFTPNNDFFTSDNPVLIKPHIQNQSPYYEGFGMRGAEIIFPISSSILLTIWDENYFENIKYNIDSFNKISDKQKREYNCYQYIFSNRQTYSFNDNFSLIKMLKACNNGNEFFGQKARIFVNGK